MFEQAPGFAGTELRRENDRVGHYLTIDRWQTLADYQRFMDAFRTEYETLDTRCTRLTDADSKIGDFETSSEL